jgi:intracellular sulfur oxidation DsrE/DsrF family protein
MDLAVLSFLVGSFVEAVSENISLDELQYPVVNRYGGIMFFPRAHRPAKDIEYKMVLSVGRAAESNGEIIPGLLQSAELINAFSVSGVPKKNVCIAVVLHGAATKAALRDETYQDFFYTDNPNNALVRQLKAADVDLHVCTQSLVRNGYRPEAIQDEFALSLSAMASVSEYQMKGYGLLSF